MKMEEIKNLENWIKDYVKSAYAKGVVLGMSGGKDSLIVAKLCINALGKENVVGVIMPNGEMIDYTDAKTTCELLGIKYFVIDIKNAYSDIINNSQNVIENLGLSLSSVTTINTAPRIRMTTLYAIAGSLNYLVANTSNLSETMTGYTTKWGDNVGDFAPLANFTKTEVCEMGLMLGLPEYLVVKTPSDGLSGKSDEDKMGITYDELDAYIRTGKKGERFDKIQDLYKKSQHKRVGAIKFDNNLKNWFNN